MSWATINSGSNNIYPNSPALMSDARHFTNYDPSCEANNVLKKHLHLNSNYDYRQYLIHQGTSVMQQNRNGAESVNLNQQIGNGKLNHNNKYIFNGVNDVNTPFGYESSNLKNIYLSRKQLQEKMEAPMLKL